jgi:hypothetical protein
VLQPRGRPCRLRRCFSLAPPSPRLRPHGRPLHRARSWLTARRPVPRSPRPGPCSSLARGYVQKRRSPRARSAQGPGRSTSSAPSATIFSRAPCPAPCTLRQGQRGEHCPARAPGARRVTLHPGKRRHTVDAPMPRRLARKRHRGHGGVHLVLASAATAWSLHSGKRRRQLTHPAPRSRGTRGARSLAPGSAHGRARARLACLGRLSPRRVLPPWTPHPGHPPGSLAALGR